MAAFLLLSVSCGIASDVRGQDWGSLSGGRGWLAVDAPDLERFADTFNRQLASTQQVGFGDFETARGWHFDVGYETVFSSVGSSLNSGLHRYSETNEARFLSGARHELELTVQDLTASWEILLYQGYLFVGPGLWISRRRVTLHSREVSPGSPLADLGLIGEYTGSGYEVRWGGIGGVWWGPFRLSVRILGSGRVLGTDDRLFDGAEEKLGGTANYFPVDYAAYEADELRGRRNAVTTNVRGRTVECAFAIFFPL